MKRHRQTSQFDPENDESIQPRSIGQMMGSGTGEEENEIVAGGWQGTDDATSTAPSDLGVDAPKVTHLHAIGEDLENEDPTGRAYAGGLDPEEGGVSDLAGRPVEESRNWEEDPI
jgi:hypothetical protein